MAIGVTAFDVIDALLVPTALVAFTVKVYSTPLVSPLTMQLVVVDEHVTVPGDANTVYPVIADPPLEAGDTQRTSALPSPGIADASVGAPGAVAAARGVTVMIADGALMPTEFFTRTRSATGKSGCMPVSVAVVAVLTPSFHTSHEEPEFVLYSMM